MTKYNNIILGSGIIGLLAKDLLGPDWTIIPFKQSRFYKYQPALYDNFIISDKRIHDVMARFGGTPKYIYKIRYSLRGQIFDYSAQLADAWLNKKFLGDPPGLASALMPSRQQFFIYDTRVNKLYIKLQNDNKEEIMTEHGLGEVTEIGDHYLVRNGKKYDFNRCISTIPLDALLNYCKITSLTLSSIPYWVYHIETDFDFEGNNQLLVVDPEIEFYKVAKIDTTRFMFYSNKEIIQPGPYFMNYLKRFDFHDGTMMQNGIIRGQKPNIIELQKYGISCIGSYAEWDWCSDVGSCIMSIMRYKDKVANNTI